MKTYYERTDVPEKLTIELGEIQRTLLLPLFGRAMETQKKAPHLVDKAAVEIVKKITYHFSTVLKDLSEVTTFGWIRRGLLIDKTIHLFIEKHPKATVINIGCGLDTTFERVDNGKIRWYDLDLPDVIELRRKLIPENERRQSIASSFLNYNWLDSLVVEDNVLFIAAGVFYYFEEKQIKDFLCKVADLFAESEVLFDATSPIGVKMANKMVLKKVSMDEKHFLKWGLKSSKIIQTWDSRLEILQEVLFFKNAKHGKSLKTMIGLLLSDMLKMQYMVHLKITG